MELDYVWVNEKYEIVSETLTYIKKYDKVEDIPSIYIENIMIKPNKIFKNPFKTDKDKIILCDLYYINMLTEPIELFISEKNKRKELDLFMKDYPNSSFKITQKYNINNNIFLEHKRLCKYIGIDIFARNGEYSIFTEKENVYNYVWLSRYILSKLSPLDIEFGELLLITNTEEDITNAFEKINTSQNEQMEYEFI
tara:strand:+ start:85 stop:672 length:588 start_codon:yes stop_codon:yes gene_type:complete